MPTSKINKIVLSLSAIIVVLLILFAIFRDNADIISLADASKLVEHKQIEKVIVSKEFIYLKTQKNLYKIASSQISPNLLKDYKIEVDKNSTFVIYILFFVILSAVASLFFRRWQKQNTDDKKHPQKKNTATFEMQESSPIQSIKSDVKFSDIGGISDVKVELEEVIDFMKNPLRYKSFGARMPRGVLLVGPPGVGKTMIAKAVAHEAEVPFYYQSGASFVQIYVGMGAKRVHELFMAAKKEAPAIIFIDE
ncbi:MAG: AAA family ATPase, partial [Campylobacterales bacterium]